MPGKPNPTLAIFAKAMRACHAENGGASHGKGSFAKNKISGARLVAKAKALGYVKKTKA